MKKGISLVALVITIIVLIILTGTVILTMGKNGIISRAQQAVSANDIAVAQEKVILEMQDIKVNAEIAGKTVVECLDDNDIDLSGKGIDYEMGTDKIFFTVNDTFTIKTDSNGKIINTFKKTSVVNPHGSETPIETYQIGKINSADAICKIYANGDMVFEGTGEIISPNPPQLLSVSKLYVTDGITNMVNCYANNINEIFLSSTVTKIEDNAFGGCDSLTNITLPEGLESIGMYAFADCTNLRNITLPEGLESIGIGAFYRCTGIINIILPEGLQHIGDGSFYGCTGITNITLPEGLQHIGSNAFTDCPITSINIPSTIVTTESAPFGGCSFTNITFANGITTIPPRIFKEITVSRIVLPNSVTTIQQCAFEDSHIGSIVIPSSVVNVQVAVFMFSEAVLKLEAESIPSTWASNWDLNFQGTIEYGYTGE